MGLDQERLRALQDLEQHSPGFLRELTGLFLADFPRGLVVLEEALARKDYGGSAKSAHQLAGSALAVGANELGELARDLERELVAGAHPVETRTLALREEWQKVSEQLRVLFS